MVYDMWNNIYFHIVCFNITFDNASKAIKQAKANGEAVSGKVWIGVATSVASILFFILSKFLPMVLD